MVECGAVGVEEAAGGQHREPLAREPAGHDGLPRVVVLFQCHTIWEGTENICCLDVRRAIQRDAAHEVLFARIDRALESASPAKSLAFAVDTVVRYGALDPAAA